MNVRDFTFVKSEQSAKYNVLDFWYRVHGETKKELDQLFDGDIEDIVVGLDGMCEIKRGDDVITVADWDLMSTLGQLVHERMAKMQKQE